MLKYTHETIKLWLYLISEVIESYPIRGGAVKTCILRMRKVWPREVKWPIQDYTFQSGLELESKMYGLIFFLSFHVVVKTSNHLFVKNTFIWGLSQTKWIGISGKVKPRHHYVFWSWPSDFKVQTGENQCLPVKQFIDNLHK